MSVNIFISVGGTANDQQESFVRNIEDRLRSENLIPNTVGRNKFSADAPLKTVMELMNECCGTIVIGLERTYLESGADKRGGSKESQLRHIKYATPWNQIEAALAYSKGHPLMLILEEGLKSEGLLEKGFDWYVMWVKPDSSSLNTPEFNGVLSSWKQKVDEFAKSKSSLSINAKSIRPEDLTISELVSALKTSSLWAILIALAAMIGGAFALGARLAGHMGDSIK